MATFTDFQHERYHIDLNRYPVTVSTVYLSPGGKAGTITQGTPLKLMIVLKRDNHQAVLTLNTDEIKLISEALEVT